MKGNTIVRFVLATLILGASANPAFAGLTPAGVYSGTVGLSVDGVGSNNTAVGNVQAEIPVGATILQAYLYSAGTPYPWYADSPRTLAAYNGAGITLAGTAINNFSTLVGATSTRPDLGAWYTARADVTSLVQSLTTGAATSNFSWAVTEGTLNDLIDGEVLAIVYSSPGLPLASVALLDGGQKTAGETTVVNLSSPLDKSTPGFAAQLNLGISFSCCRDQMSNVDVNGSALTRFAGNFDDGAAEQDGSLITVGGLGDNPANNVASYADDDELYDLAPFLSNGDTSFSIFTSNPTNDDNIFFASLYLTGAIRDINDGSVPEPGSLALLLGGLGMVGAARRRRVLQV